MSMMTKSTTKVISEQLCSMILSGSSNRSDLQIQKEDQKKLVLDLSREYQKDNNLSITELVQTLESLLTSTDYETRARGVSILTSVIVSLPEDRLNSKEIDTLFTFLCLRLSDDKSMHRDVLKCFQYLMHNTNKPGEFPKKLFDSLKHQTNIRTMTPNNRHLVMEIVTDIFTEHHTKTRHITNDLIFGLVHLIEGESDPECLLLSYRLVASVSRWYTNLEPYVEDIVDWLSSYYPISYTPPPGQTRSIKRDDLVDALYDCFIANELFAENVLSLIRSKLESNLVSSKLDSYDCLERCVCHYPASKVEECHLSFWTCIRMDCLRPENSMDDILFNKALSALSALIKAISLDGYDRMVHNIYSDLNLAFTKVEMNLFKPATYLMVHSILRPMSEDNIVSPSAFFIEEITSITSKLLSSEECQSYGTDILWSLNYIFEKVASADIIFPFLHNPDDDHTKKRDEYLEKILNYLTSSSITDEICSLGLQVINSLVSCSSKHVVRIGEDALKKIVSTLKNLLDASRCDEDCINLLRMIGNRFGVQIVDCEQIMTLLKRREHDVDSLGSLVRGLSIKGISCDDQYLILALRVFIDTLMNEETKLVALQLGSLIELSLRGSNLKDKLLECWNLLFNHLKHLIKCNQFVITDSRKCMIRMSLSLLYIIADRLDSAFIESQLKTTLHICMLLESSRSLTPEVSQDCTLCRDSDTLNIKQIKLRHDQWCLWLGLVEILLHSLNSECIIRSFSNPIKVNEFLIFLRTSIRAEIKCPLYMTTHVAKLHTIIINKLQDSILMEVLMPFLSSDFCQDLASSTLEDESVRLMYATVVKWVLKALVIRNHNIAVPIMNLILNAISSSNLSPSSALELSTTFPFILSEDELEDGCRIRLFDTDKHYIRFPLYKQKFFCQSFNEILIRHKNQTGVVNNSGLQALVLALVSQMRYLPETAIKNYYSKLLPLTIKSLSVTRTLVSDGTSIDLESLRAEVFQFLNQVITGDKRDIILPHLEDLIGICLDLASKGTLKERVTTLKCIARIANHIEDSHLVSLRPRMILGLRSFLADKKRLVRSGAVDARLAWFMVGQPGKP